MEGEARERDEDDRLLGGCLRCCWQDAVTRARGEAGRRGCAWRHRRRRNWRSQVSDTRGGLVHERAGGHLRRWHGMPGAGDGDPRGSRVVPVPLLYTGEIPTITNDSTIAGAHLAALCAGGPVSRQPAYRPADAGGRVRIWSVAALVAVVAGAAASRRPLRRSRSDTRGSERRGRSSDGEADQRPPRGGRGVCGAAGDWGSRTSMAARGRVTPGTTAPG